jgi:poly-gamma-glutamate synthesis protein (capsule biosynthesis protein)
VILMLHWGLEYSPMPTPEQVALAHAACDRGVSVILGHHSHCIQGIERYNGAIIAYSLANLTDDGVDWQGPSRHYQAPLTEIDRESLLLRLHLRKDGVEIVDTVPLWLDDDGRPTPADGERAAAIQARIQQRSAQIASTEDLETYWRDTVIGRRVADPLLSWWRDGDLLDKVRRFRPGQIVSAWLLLTTFLKLRFSRSESRWLLFSSRNDTRPMPAVRKPRKLD